MDPQCACNSMRRRHHDMCQVLELMHTCFTDNDFREGARMKTAALKFNTSIEHNAISIWYKCEHPSLVPSRLHLFWGGVRHFSHPLCLRIQVRREKLRKKTVLRKFSRCDVVRWAQLWILLDTCLEFRGEFITFSFTWPFRKKAEHERFDHLWFRHLNNHRSIHASLKDSCALFSSCSFT